MNIEDKIRGIIIENSTLEGTHILPDGEGVESSDMIIDAEDIDKIVAAVLTVLKETK